MTPDDTKMRMFRNVLDVEIERMRYSLIMAHGNEVDKMIAKSRQNIIHACEKCIRYKPIAGWINKKLKSAKYEMNDTFNTPE